MSMAAAVAAADPCVCTSCTVLAGGVEEEQRRREPTEGGGARALGVGGRLAAVSTPPLGSLTR